MNNLPIFSASRFALISTGLAGTILCASMLGLPRAAQAQNLNAQEVAQAEPDQAGQKPGKTIPADSALVVRFCAPVTLNTKNKSSLVNAALAQPLLDSNGRIAVPVNTLVGVQLKPTAEGAEITANNLVVGSRYLPVQTSSVSIPLEIQVQEKSASRENNRQGTVSNLARGAQVILSQQGVVNQSTGDFLGAGLSILSGITRKSNKPKVIKTMEVPQGSTFVLPFSSAVTLPAIASKAASNQTVCSTNTGTSEVVTDSEEDTETEEEAETTEAAPQSEVVSPEEEAQDTDPEEATEPTEAAPQSELDSPDPEPPAEEETQVTDEEEATEPTEVAPEAKVDPDSEEDTDTEEATEATQVTPEAEVDSPDPEPPVEAETQVTDEEEDAETTEAALESESEIDSQETDATADSATDPDDFEEEVK